MNPDLSRPRPAGQEEHPLLPPFAERELPAGRHQFHKERLMAQIHEDLRAADTAARGPVQAAPARVAGSRNPFLRRAVFVPAAAFALAGALAVGFLSYVDRGAADGPGSTVATGPALTTRIGTADPKGAPQLLDRISLASASVSGPAVRADQFVYIGSKAANTYVKTVGNKSTLVSLPLHVRHQWNSPDGTKGWLIEPGNTGPEGVTLAGLDEKGNTPTPYLNAPTYDYLAALPTDPDVLLRRIYEETKGMGNGPDQEAFTTIGDLLRSSYPPAELTTALYKAAAKIPGVVTVDEAVDAAGRSGVAVARLDEHSGQRVEWIFDRQTLTFLGERSVQVQGESGEQGLIKPGTVVYTSAVMTRTVVDRIKELPPTAP
ncbi:MULTISPECIES: CU044_5270 family protein [unclassified Streptomyces]|uniref:CU044_5270 family protein n=1 Tax=unclassified Streptomyces TaxID=2593676 RepID=UPI002E130602|nr:CU044_5270 family protein [Streptomyces sp. NBC_01207]WTA18646.1 CU044_5270 family protein [Streptomyces sp. NBC_00853]